jgi:hypothetical protein
VTAAAFTSITQQAARRMGTIPALTRQDLVVAVGGPGREVDLGAELEALLNLYPGAVGRDAGIRLRILAGSAMAGQAVIARVDLAHIRLEAEDAEVPVRRAGLTQVVSPEQGYDRRPWLALLEGARGPLLAARFAMDAGGAGRARDGILVASGASLAADPDAGAGVVGAGGEGLHALNAGALMLAGTVWDGAGRSETDPGAAYGRGVWARGCAWCCLDRARADGTHWTGLQLQSTPGSAVGARVADAGHYGIRARGAALVDCRDAVVLRSLGHALNVNEASFVSAVNATLDGGRGLSEPAVLVDRVSGADLTGASVAGDYNGLIEARGAGATIHGLPAAVANDRAGGWSFRVRDGATISGRGIVAAGFTAGVPFNCDTPKGRVLDEESLAGTATIAADGTIAVTHGLTLIAGRDATTAGRTVTGVTLPGDTPDGVALSLGALAQTGAAITLAHGATIRHHGEGARVIDNADAGGAYTRLYRTDTGGGVRRLVEYRG